MRLQTSLCNKTLIRKDLMRFWPIWTILIAVMFSVIIMDTLLGIHIQVSSVGPDHIDESELYFIISYINSSTTGGSMMILIFLASVITAAGTFGYLNKPVSSYMIHSLPITRQAHCMSHLLSGFLMIAGPVTLNYLALFVINLCYGVHMSGKICEYYLEALIMILFFYSLSSLITLLCGSGLLSAIVYFVANFACVVGYWLLECIHSVISYAGSFGFDFNINSLWVKCTTPLLGMYRLLSSDHYGYGLFSSDYAVTEPGLNDVAFLTSFSGATLGKFALYLIPVLIFVLLCVLLYTRRPLEKTGDLLIFRRSVPVFRFVFVFFGSLLFTGFVYIISEGLMASTLTYRGMMISSMLIVAVGAVLSYIICDMILSKTFRVWSGLSPLQLLTFAVLMAMLVMGQGNDYRHSLADSPDEVSEIRFTDGNSEHILEYTDKNDIEGLLKLEEQMSSACRSDMDKLTVDEVSMGNCYEICITLRDGSVKTRNYSLSYGLEQDLLEELVDYINEPERALRSVTLFQIETDSFNSLDVYNYAEFDAYDYYDILFETAAARNKLIDAVKMDVKEGNLAITWITDYTTDDSVYSSGAEPIGRISAFYNKQDDSSGETYFSCYIQFNENCSHILKVIEDEM